MVEYEQWSCLKKLLFGLLLKALLSKQILAMSEIKKIFMN